MKKWVGLILTGIGFFGAGLVSADHFVEATVDEAKGDLPT